MKLRSRAFQDGGDIPPKYAMRAVTGGANVSIPLSWQGAPEGVKAFALTIVDPHPVADNWLHWVAINIPPETSELAEGASGVDMPRGALELINSFGQPGYGGPQPPPGSGKHPYVVTVYALGVKWLSLGPRAGLKGFLGAVSGCVLGKAEVVGYFER
jgi:Raf kinase inhibitor-like YbhB/YbcL family protein